MKKRSQKKHFHPKKSTQKILSSLQRKRPATLPKITHRAQAYCLSPMLSVTFLFLIFLQTSFAKPIKLVRHYFRLAEYQDDEAFAFCIEANPEFPVFTSVLEQLMKNTCGYYSDFFPDESSTDFFYPDRSWGSCGKSADHFYGNIYDTIENQHDEFMNCINTLAYKAIKSYEDSLTPPAEIPTFDVIQIISSLSLILGVSIFTATLIYSYCRQKQTPKTNAELITEADIDISVDAEAEHYFCPITHEIMTNPTVAQDGNTYEKSALEKWKNQHDRCPLDPSKNIEPMIENVNLKKMINAYVKKKLEQKKEERASLQQHCRLM